MSIAAEKEVRRQARPSDALAPIPDFFPIPRGSSEKRKEPLEGHTLDIDFRRATCALRAGLERFYPMGDPELPTAQIAATPPLRYFNGMLAYTGDMYMKKLKASSAGNVVKGHYAILLERTRNIFGSVLDAQSMQDLQEKRRRLWTSDDERGRVMKVILTEKELAIVRDMCIGYGFRDEGRTQATAWGISYPLEMHLPAHRIGDPQKPRPAFLHKLLNIDLGRLAA